MAQNGGIIGPQNVPTALKASGLWGLQDILYAKRGSAWPQGNFRTEVGSFTKQNATGNQDVTIQTDLSNAAAGTWAIAFWTSTTAGANSWYPHPWAGVGFVANGGGSMTQYAVATNIKDAQGASSTARRMAAKAIVITEAGSGTVAEADMVGFPSSTTMRLNWTTNGGGSGWAGHNVNYILLSGLTAAKVVNWTTLAAAGTKSVAGAGFSPDLVLHASITQDTIPVSAAWAAMTFGMMNKHGQQASNSFVSVSGVTPSNASRWQQTDACLAVVADNETAYGQAHFVSMDADGFTTYFSTGPGSTRQVISLCLKGVSSKIGAFTKATATAPTSQTVHSRQGFIPNGMITTEWSDPPQATPRPGAWWGVGLSDTANHRSAAFYDEDNFATTSAKGIWRNDGVSIRSANSVFAVPSFAAESISLAYPTNDSTASEVLYLLMGESAASTFPATLRFNGEQNSTQGPAQKRVTTLASGQKLAVVEIGGWGYFFKDGGLPSEPWVLLTDATTSISGWDKGSIDSYVQQDGTVKVITVWRQNGAGGGRTSGDIYYAVGTYDGAAITWHSIASVGNGLGVPGFDYPDVACHAYGTGGRAHLALPGHRNDTNGNYLFYARIAVSSSGTVTSEQAATQLGSTVTGITVIPVASIDVDTSTYNIGIGWMLGATGATAGVRGQFASHSGGVWTFGGDRQLTSAYKANGLENGLRCIADPARSRFVIGGTPTTGAYQQQWAVARNYADTATAALFDVYTTAAADFMLHGQIALDLASGDVYIVGAAYDGTTTVMGINYRKFTHATSTLGAVIRSDSFIGTSWTGGSGAVSTDSFEGGVSWIYPRGNGATYVPVVYDRIQL